MQIEQDGKPRALGLEFTRSMLADLPYDPPFDGNNCFDINGDGELTFHLPMPECAAVIKPFFSSRRRQSNAPICRSSGSC